MRSPIATLVILALARVVSLTATRADADRPRLLTPTPRPSITGAGDSLNPVLSGNGRFVAFTSNADDLVRDDANGGRSDVFLRSIDAPEPVTLLISVNTNGTSGNGPSRQPSVSRDGRRVAFVSEASDLVYGDTNGVADVFVRDTVDGVTVRVSLPPDDSVDLGDSGYPILSADGRFVAFESSTTRTGGNAVQRFTDVFLHDLASGVTRWINSPSSSPALRNRAAGSAGIVALSDDGTTVLFTAEGLNLAPGLTVGSAVLTNNLYVLRAPATTNRMVPIVLPNENPPAGSRPSSAFAGLSADGRHVTLVRRASNTNALPVAFLRVDLDERTVVRLDAPIDALPDAGLTEAVGPLLSADGRLAVFESRRRLPVGTGTLRIVEAWNADTGLATRVSSSGWVTGPDGPLAESPWGDLLGASRNGEFVAFLGASTNDPPDGPTNQIVVRRLANGELRRISRTATGAPLPENLAPAVSFSDDGRRMAFQSPSDAIDEGDLNRAWDIFLYDWDTDQLRLISRSASGRESITGPGHSWTVAGAMDSEGRTLAYTTLRSDLAPGDANGGFDVYVRLLDRASNVLVSVSQEGRAPGNGPSVEVALDGQGRRIAFSSRASDLVTGDTNGVTDVFLRDLESGTTLLVSRRPDGSPSAGASGRPALSRDGRYVAFESSGSDLDPLDRNTRQDLYLFDATLLTVQLVSRNSAGMAAGNGTSGRPVFSPDGKWLVFESTAGDLATPNVSSGRRIMAWNVVDRTMRRLTPADANSLALGGPFNPIAVFTPDGRFAATSRTNLNGTGINLQLDDLAGGESILLPVAGLVASLNRDATRIAYRTAPTNGTEWPQARLIDRPAGIDTLLSAAPDGTPGNAPTGFPLLTPDGRFVLFTSGADNLLPSASSRVTRLYLRDLATDATTRLTDGVWAGSPVLAADGRTLVFAAIDDALADGDLNQDADLYLARLPGAESDFRITTVARLATGEVTLLWPARAGTAYEVEGTADLKSAWSPLPIPVQIEDSTARAVDPDTAARPMRFYRVRER